MKYNYWIAAKILYNRFTHVLNPSCCDQDGFFLMLQNYTYKFRLYPNELDKVLLSKHFGCCRFVYNYFLAENKIEYESIKKYNNYYKNCEVLKEIKKEYNWLKEVNSQSLQIALKNLETSFQRFFKKISGFPKFHKKFNTQSFSVTNQSFKIEENRVILPKFRKGIKFDNHREIEGEIINSTISKTPDEKYYISITVEKEISQLNKIDKEIGIDLGIKDFCITSDEIKIYNPKFKKSKISKLKFLHKKHSKKQLKSKNREKSRKKLAKLYSKINNLKTDFLHKLSTNLIHENQVIYLENLNIKGMVKNHKLAEEISQCNWGQFISILEYKANWYGREIYQIDRFYPSSQLCSNCGYQNHNLTLKDREWVCPKCGYHHDRDINAAKNILNCGRDCRKKSVELPSLEGVMKQKTMNHLGL